MEITRDKLEKMCNLGKTRQVCDSMKYCTYDNNQCIYRTSNCATDSCISEFGLGCYKTTSIADIKKQECKSIDLPKFCNNFKDKECLQQGVCTLTDGKCVSHNVESICGIFDKQEDCKLFNETCLWNDNKCNIVFQCNDKLFDEKSCNNNSKCTWLSGNAAKQYLDKAKINRFTNYNSKNSGICVDK